MNPAPTGAPQDFTNVARAMLLSKTASDAVAMAEHARFDRAQKILKAVVAGGSLGDPAWAGALHDYAVAVGGFVESLRSVSVFDAMLTSMVRVPMQTRAVFTTIAATGSVVAQLGFKPVSRLTLDAADLTPRKAVTIFVMSEELARVVAAVGGDVFLTNELRGGVGAATDLEFVGELPVGATEIASNGGSSAVDVYQDLGALLAVVPVGQNSRLFFIMSPLTAAVLSAKPDANGAPAFPMLAPTGGEVCNVPVLTSDALASESEGASILLVDAAGVAADSQTITLSRATAATLQLDSAPVSDASAVMQSLWQSNQVGLKAERYFSFARLRDNAVAELRGAEYAAS